MWRCSVHLLSEAMLLLLSLDHPVRVECRANGGGRANCGAVHVADRGGRFSRRVAAAVRVILNRRYDLTFYYCVVLKDNV
jgi:hypothetical protein